MQIDPAILTSIAALTVALVLILAAAELFTNGIEWLGQKLQLSEGVVGSVLAAVGTALPETLIPIVAVLFGKDDQSHGIGIGAIAGAPFMLTTLTMSVCGCAVLIFSKRNKRSAELTINKTVLTRDLGFFIGAYTLALAVTLLKDILPARQLLAVCLLFIYAWYLKKTFSHEGEVGTAPEELHFGKLLKLKTSLTVVILQVLAGLAGIFIGAAVFVEHTKVIAHAIDVPTVILAFIIAPIATELPEKFNSVIWVRNKKDTLALGNITGALVFQSCFPVAFGVAFTNWNLGLGTIISGCVAIASALTYLLLIRQEKLRYQHLMLGSVFYLLTVSWLLYTHLTD